MTGATTTPEAEIKRLLLAAELDLLYALRDRCDELGDRVGDDRALRDSVHRVIVDVLRKAQVDDHDRVAAALAPLVVASIHAEIRNSRDMMVDALYPITGRLVAAAVRNAFQTLIDNLNEKLDRSVSVDRWVRRLRARMSGRSEAELLLRDEPPFDIGELLVIHRPTGLLICRIGDAAPELVDRDLVAGMLTAIMAFTRDAFGATEGQTLRTLAFGDAELFLTASPAVILVVSARGIAPPGLEPRLQALFVDIVDRWGPLLRDFTGSLDEDQQSTLEDDLRTRFRQLFADRRPRDGRRRYKAYVLLALILLALVGWAGYGTYQGFRAAAIERTARAAVFADPALTGYPVTIRYDRDREVLDVAGLLPRPSARERIEAALDQALPEVAVELRLGSLPAGNAQTEEAAARIAALEAALAGELGQIENRLLDVAAAFGAADTRVAEQLAAIAEDGLRLEDDLQAVAEEMRLADTQFAASRGGLEGEVRTIEEEVLRSFAALRSDMEALEGRLGSIGEQLAAVEDTVQAAAQEMRLADTQFAASRGGLEDVVRTIEEEVLRNLASVRSELDALDGRLDSIGGQLAAMEADAGAPKAALLRWMGQNALFFADGTNPVAPDEAADALSALAGLMEAAPDALKVRIIGYSDAIGSAEINRDISLARARSTAAALTALGVDPARLIAVGRGTSKPLSNEAGTGSSNRRVEFEFVLAGEADRVTGAE